MLRVWFAVAGLVALLACTPAFAAPGDPDLSFGLGGLVAVQANAACVPGCVEFGGSYANALVLQPDGGIVLGGYDVSAGTPVLEPGALVRLRLNGEFDMSFGGAGGILDVPLVVGDLWADAHGRLLVTGEAEGGKVGMQRYTANGVLDTSFGSAGTRLMPSFAREMTLDRYGRLLGPTKVSVPATFFKPGTWWLGVKRLRVSGQIDRSFGHDGYAVLPDAREATALGVLVQRDGGMIVAYRQAQAPVAGDERQQQRGVPSRSLIVRLTSRGELDRRFGSHGIARFPPADITSSALMSMRRGHLFVVAGEGTNDNEGLVFADYTYTGHLDPNFGKSGVARISFPQGERFWGISPRAITFDAVSDAIVVGEQRIRTVDTPAGDAFVARFTPSGRDCSFGTEGLRVDDRFTAANAVAVQLDGRIVVAGGAKRFVAARYLGAGAPRTCPGEPRTNHG